MWRHGRIGNRKWHLRQLRIRAAAIKAANHSVIQQHLLASQQCRHRKMTNFSLKQCLG
jgi:hypothetical protein